jgi:hypothetical protein
MLLRAHFLSIAKFLPSPAARILGFRFVAFSETLFESAFSCRLLVPTGKITGVSKTAFLLL